MTDSMRSMFKNDTVIGRHLDGDDSESGSDKEDAPRSSSSLRDAEGVNHQGRGGSGGTHNTGPKGVRSDARAFKATRSASRLRMAQGIQAQESRIPRASTYAEEEMERDARERWVEARLKELSKSRADLPHSSFHASLASSLFEEVDATRYLELVESLTLVCVLIYNDHDEEEEEDEQVMETLGPIFRRYRGISKTIKLRASEAEMDPVACPALLLYRDGQLIQSSLRLVDEIPSSHDINTRSVESVLLQLGILSPSYRID